MQHGKPQKKHDSLFLMDGSMPTSGRVWLQLYAQFTAEWSLSSRDQQPFRRWCVVKQLRSGEYRAFELTVIHEFPYVFDSKELHNLDSDAIVVKISASLLL